PGAPLELTRQTPFDMTEAQIGVGGKAPGEAEKAWPGASLSSRRSREAELAFTGLTEPAFYGDREVYALQMNSVGAWDSNSAACLRPSTWRNQLDIWFQLAKIRLPNCWFQ